MWHKPTRAKELGVDSLPALSMTYNYTFDKSLEVLKIYTTVCGECILLFIGWYIRVHLLQLFYTWMIMIQSVLISFSFHNNTLYHNITSNLDSVARGHFHKIQFDEIFIVHM
jgi:hypothetical protein